MFHPMRSLLPSALSLTLLCGGCALGKVIEDGPQHLSEMSSIGRVLKQAGTRSVHILYVHGMDATGSGDSVIFQEGICRILKDCSLPSSATRDYADTGIYAKGSAPPPFEYMGIPVWSTPDEWSASAPFVDHYVIQRRSGGPIVVDEINWWPLVFPLKCRNILTGEAQLAGPSSTLLDLCSTPIQKNAQDPARFDHYPWISKEQATTYEAMPHRGALVNRDLKNSILDWGVSDAFMVVGSMRTLFQEGMRQLLVKTARFHANGTPNSDWVQQLKNPQAVDREFLLVSHSLGSYLVFSTLNLSQPLAASRSASDQSSDNPDTQAAAAQYILERTSQVYFFANQVPLLELSDVDMPAGAAVAATPGSATVAPPPKAAISNRIKRWRELRQQFRQRTGAEVAGPQEPEVFAWSDPSDMLTWHVPPLEGVKVDNLYVRNTWWHWLFADPSSAHGRYAKNKEVLRTMMRD